MRSAVLLAIFLSVALSSYALGMLAEARLSTEAVAKQYYTDVVWCHLHDPSIPLDGLPTQYLNL